jgi:hypothetical protein
MKVRIIKTGEVKLFEAGYALRLIEQGKAAPVKEADKPAAKKEPEPKTTEQPKAEAKGKK